MLTNTDSGRPLLVVPYVYIDTVPAKSVLVGWNGSAQAARALNESFALLRAADSVEVIHVEDADDRRPDEQLSASVPVSEHLARHGIDATATSIPKSKIDPGDVLLNRASDTGADLIVVGAWGHSRAGELLFGGTTRSLLKHMAVPVFISHS